MLKWLKWIVLGLLALYMLIGFVILPYVVKSQAITFIEENSEALLEIEEVSFNPFTCIVRVKKAKLVDPYGLTLLKADKIVLDLNLYDILSKKIHLKSFRLTGLQVNVAHFKKGDWSYAWLMELGPQKAA